MTKIKHKGRIYRRSAFERNAMVLVYITLFGMYGVIAFHQNELGLLLFLIIISIALVPVLYPVYHAYVRVHDEGLQIVRGGHQVFVHWDEIKAFGVRGKFHGVRLYERIHRPPLMSNDSRNFINLQHALPLSRRWSWFGRPVDLAKLLKTDFGRNVYRHAPHIFEDVAEKGKRRG